MTVEKMEFKAELKQVMEIIVHSLYSHREIFLRELISNACDAIDRVRFDSIQDQSLIENNGDWGIRITADKANKTLTISDNGIGLSHETIVADLGTIARSGTSAFLENLKQSEVKDRPELIGQFGVGFYSSFMVADKVVVRSRKAGSPDDAVEWTCEGGEGYTVESITKEKRGTDIILHLKEDAEEFLDEWRLREIVKKYSDFVEFPISLAAIDAEGKDVEIKEPIMNSQKALWLRSKSDITPEEYNEFYKAIAHDFTDPLETIHYSAEGTIEFKALLFLPSKRPFDLFTTETKVGPALYVQRVQIMDHCDKLLPMYLRFVKGVVDSTDLPLNVSRELLQQNATLAKIKNNLVTKILGVLKDMKAKDYDKYVSFYTQFGDVLKEGVNDDFANKDKISELLLFHSTATGSDEEKFVTLESYVSTLTDDDKEIFYLSGDNLETLTHSPYLESFKSKGQEVLLLNSPIDSWVMDSLREYKGKTFKAIDRGELKTDETDDFKEKKKTFGSLMSFLKDKLPGIKEVRLSTRLTDSASCLIVDEYAMNAHMERIMQRMGQKIPETERILELNPEHAAVKTMLELYDSNSENPHVVDYGMIFYDMAVLAEGSKIKDPAAFAHRINDLIVNANKPQA
ncbi:MAG: molecular chaperone HtpG [Spartobacteria bacterium]|nr:molecular chaperone HtpG [Spartobacteria bacterium]